MHALKKNTTREDPAACHAESRIKLHVAPVRRAGKQQDSQTVGKSYQNAVTYEQKCVSHNFEKFHVTNKAVVKVMTSRVKLRI